MTKDEFLKDYSTHKLQFKSSYKSSWTYESEFFIITGTTSLGEFEPVMDVFDLYDELENFEFEVKTITT